MGRRNSRSQPARRSNERKSKDGGTRSQTSVAESFNQIAVNDVNVTDQINDCVRFMVFRAGHHLPFRKADLLKVVPGAVVNRNYEKIIEKSSEILKDVYGYNLIILDSNSSKSYFISNYLRFVEDDSVENNDPQEIPEDSHKILLMLILTHLFMSNNNVSQASMYSFLKAFNIDPEGRQAAFGNVNIKEYLTGTLVKQKYITIEKNSVSEKLTFSWGPRAEQEISKHAILKFVCKVYKDCTPEAWASQFKEAETQGLENVQVGVETETMEVQGM